MLVIMVVAVGIIVLFFFILLFVHIHKNEAPPPEKKYPVKGPVHATKGKPDVSQAKQSFNTDAQKKTLLELYPALREVSYSPVPEGMLLTPAGSIEESIRGTIQEKVSSIKPLPANYAKLLNLLRDPKSNPGEISTIVSTNPVFSAKILQTVNSAYFGLSEKVTSLGRAITLLGYNNVRALVLQDSLGSIVPGQQAGHHDTYVNIWVHSAIVSVCAGYLGKRMFQFSEYDLATIGLLHDIGKYFISSLDVQKETASNMPHMIQEEQRYGINHASLGSLIAGAWQLSDTIVNGIEYHHYPNFLLPESIPEPHLKQCFVVCISDLIAKALGYRGKEEEVLPVRDEYFEMFRLSPELADIVTPVLTKEIEKSRLAVESYIKSTISG